MKARCYGLDAAKTFRFQLSKDRNGRHDGARTISACSFSALPGPPDEMDLLAYPVNLPDKPLR
jgi:hypothetical protein